MRIGTMFFGRVESVDAECIETKFLVIGLPLLPLESVYVLDEGTRQGIVLPQVHATSMVAGYLRVGLGMAAAGFGVWGFFGGEPVAWFLATLCAVGWGAAMMGLGRLSDRERAQRSVLKALTGIGAPPEVLPEVVRTESAALLERVYGRLRAKPGIEAPARWRDLLGRPVRPELRLLLFALARLHAEDHEAVWDQG